MGSSNVTTGKFAVCVAGILSLFALALVAIVALEIAHRPVGTVMWLTGAMAVPTGIGLLNYATNRQIRYDLHNGAGTAIAEHAAGLVIDQAAVVAQELVHALPPESAAAAAAVAHALPTTTPPAAPG